MVFNRCNFLSRFHFFQLIWKDTVKVGIAVGTSVRNGVITVARFHPLGNIGFIDDYVRNVAPRGRNCLVKNGCSHRLVIFLLLPGITGSNDGFDGDRSQSGPSCRRTRKRKVVKSKITSRHLFEYL